MQLRTAIDQLNLGRALNYAVLRSGLPLLLSVATVPALSILISGCASPVVASRQMQYSVDYVENGSIHSLHLEYGCYLDYPVWEEGGPEWNNRTTIVIHLNGHLQNGRPFTITPIWQGNTSDWAHQTTCADKDVNFRSALFFKSSESDPGFHSFDDTRTSFEDESVKIIRSTVQHRGSGVSAHSSKYEEILPPTYYTVMMGVLPAEKIDTLGLRSYVDSKKSKWLTPGQHTVFHKWTDEDVAASRKLKGQVIALVRPEDGIGLTADYRNGEWNFPVGGSKAATQWFRQEAWKLEGAAPRDEDLKLSRMRYAGFTFDLPTAGPIALDFYDPKTDCIYVFYIVQSFVPAP